MTHRQLKEALQQAAEPAYRDFASALIPGETRLLGVRLPHLRKLARQLAKQDWRGFLNEEPQNASFEELMVRALLPAYAPDADCAERLRFLLREQPRLDNWSLCDSCCATCKFAAQHRAKVWDTLQPLLRSHAEFDIRFALVMALFHFVPDAAWAATVTRILPTLHYGAKYADLAAAWCACEIALRHPHLRETLLAPDFLPQPILSLTLRKIRESRRTL